MDIRDKYLSNFEPGMGMVSMIHVRFPTKVESINQRIEKLKQTEDYPGSNPYNRIWLWFGLWRSNDQSIFNKCLELGAEKIEPDKCQFDRGGFNTAGVTTDLVFVDVDW